MLNPGLDKLTQEDSNWQRLEEKATQVVEQYSSSQELARGRLQAESTWLRHQSHELERSAKANFPFMFPLVKYILSLYASSTFYTLFALGPIRAHKVRCLKGMVPHIAGLWKTSYMSYKDSHMSNCLMTLSQKYLCISKRQELTLHFSMQTHRIKSTFPIYGWIPMLK